MNCHDHHYKHYWEKAGSVFFESIIILQSSYCQYNLPFILMMHSTQNGMTFANTAFESNAVFANVIPFATTNVVTISIIIVILIFIVVNTIVIIKCPTHCVCNHKCGDQPHHYHHQQQIYITDTVAKKSRIYPCNKFLRWTALNPHVVFLKGIVFFAEFWDFINVCSIPVSSRPDYCPDM